MLAASAFSCAQSYFFDDLCNTVNKHDPSGIFGPLIERLIGPIVIFALVFAVGRVARRVVDRAAQRAHGDPQVRALVRNVGGAVIYFFAALSGLVTAGVPLAFLLTFGGLASLAIGLAFQDVLRNVLAGIWLLVERPFRIGDLITISEMAGVVQNITLRTTSLRTGEGRLAILPNLTVFSGIVVNSSAYGQRQYTLSASNATTTSRWRCAPRVASSRPRTRWPSNPRRALMCSSTARACCCTASTGSTTAPTTSMPSPPTSLVGCG